VSEKIKCGNCGLLLYFGEEIKRRLCMRALPSEASVLALYNNTCPRCGRELSGDTVRIEIKRRNHGT
jgi:hypothetical protein